MGQAAKFFGLLYGTTNAIGAIGWYVANYQSHLVRKKGDPLGNPQADLEALLKDPQGYIDKNYQVDIFGWTFNPGSALPGFDEASGDLMVFNGTDGAEFYRRIPEDLYNALKTQAENDGSSPFLALSVL